MEMEVADRLLEQWSALMLKWESASRKSINALARKGVPDRLRSQVGQRTPQALFSSTLLP